MKPDKQTLMTVIALGLFLALAPARAALADDAAADETVTADAGKDAKGAKAPWRGSSIGYRNAVAARSLDKSYEPTYDPYYAMSFDLSPRWWFGDIFYVNASASVLRELTHSNYTTYDGEWEWGDTVLGGGASGFYTIPWVGLRFSGGLSMSFPTSKFSRYKTMLMSLKPSLSMSRTFPLLSGLTLSYSLSGTKYFHEYTTPMAEKATLSPHPWGAYRTSDYQSSGSRNAEWRLANSFGLSMQFLDWLGLSASFGMMHDYLYDLSEMERHDAATNDPSYAVSSRMANGDDMRYTFMYGLELSVQPMKSLSLGLGASTVNPQLKPDSTYREPFYNRYTTLYLDLRFNIDGFISQITGN